MKKMLRVPRMVLIGSFMRNEGKTTLATGLIAAWKDRLPVYALKVVTVEEGEQVCRHGDKGCGLCEELKGAYELRPEDGERKEKDTAKLLLAGAKSAYLLCGRRAFLREGLEAYLERVPKDALLICESNSLRGVVEPGVFLMVAGGPKEGQKPTAKAVAHLADRIVDPREIPALHIEHREEGSLAVSLGGGAGHTNREGKKEV